VERSQKKMRTRDVVAGLAVAVVVIAVYALVTGPFGSDARTHGSLGQAPTSAPMDTIGPRAPLGPVGPLAPLAPLPKSGLVTLAKTRRKLVVGGTARDCAPYLSRVLARLEELARAHDVYFVFYESNSSDATHEILLSFVATHAGKVFTERTDGTRTQRIARGRNAIVAHAEQVSSDFFVNVDMDDRCTDIDVPSVLECIDRSSEWGVATSNRREYYYDLWALRTPALGNCYARGDECEAHVLGEWFPDFPELKDARTFPSGGRAYYPVDSAFSGLAVYRSRLLAGARYTGTTTDGGPECEHAPFHAAIRAQFPGTRVVVATYMYSGP
jgi:hypothetical protein